MIKSIFFECLKFRKVIGQSLTWNKCSVKIDFKGGTVWDIKHGNDIRPWSEKLTWFYRLREGCTAVFLGLIRIGSGTGSVQGTEGVVSIKQV